MKKTTLDRDCSVVQTIEIFGDRWILLIIREAFFGIHYYDQFVANLGIATNILSDRLKRLVENGIMVREKDRSDKRRVWYGLTEKGLDLYPITLALMPWGDRWLFGEKGPPLELSHRSCGSRLEPVRCCPTCGEVVQAKDVDYKTRPV